MRDSNPTRQANSQRALRILAKSVHRELKSSGYSRSEIVAFTNELLGLVTTDIKAEPEPARASTSLQLLTRS